MNQILKDYNKILEGCGKEINHNVMNIITLCGRGNDYIRITKDKIQLAYKFELCPSCSKAKEIFLERCQSELKRLNKFLSLGVTCGTKSNKFLEEWISQLKEVLEQKQ